MILGLAVTNIIASKRESRTVAVGGERQDPPFLDPSLGQMQCSPRGSSQSCYTSSLVTNVCNALRALVSMAGLKTPQATAWCHSALVRDGTTALLQSSPAVSAEASTETSCPEGKAPSSAVGSEQSFLEFLQDRPSKKVPPAECSTQVLGNVWSIAPTELTISKQPNGKDWLLGSGVSGERKISLHTNR